MILKFPVKVPQQWLRHNIQGDITITVEVQVIVGDTFNMIVRHVVFPGWHAFNINSFNYNNLYDLVEQMAMDRYAQARPYNDEHECYD